MLGTTVANKVVLKLYTKTGDKGHSSVLSGERITKNSPIFEVLGTIDELNSWLGLCVTTTRKKSLKKELMTIQDLLLITGALVAGSNSVILKQSGIKKLENRIDYYQKHTRKDWYTKFLLPGGAPLAAHIDITRAICRRLERRLVDLNQHSLPTTNQPINQSTLILAFINRLSDYLFALRCFVNSQAGYEEKLFEPTYTKTLSSKS